MHDPHEPARPPGSLDRRGFLKRSLSAAAAAAAVRPLNLLGAEPGVVVDDFDRPDALYHGDGWESMNPGYWMIREGALRRRLRNRGDQRPGNRFPWHWETSNRDPRTPTYDPSLPFGMIWRRDWDLRGNYRVVVEATVRALPPYASGSEWKQDHPGYGLMGVGFGSKCLHESWAGSDTDTGGGDGGGQRGQRGDAAWMAVWRDDGRFGIYDHATDEPRPAFEGGEERAPVPRPGDRVTIEVEVSGTDPRHARVAATMRVRDVVVAVEGRGIEREPFTDGYFGLVARGLLDWEVNQVSIDAGENRPFSTPLTDLHVAYALGDSLREESGVWRCRFVALFRSDGGRAEIRVAEASDPRGGWGRVPAAGVAPIVSNGFRLHTAVVDVELPANPADATLYFTVWKDGRDVTGDPRLGTRSTGPGTGYLGQVPESGRYVGRLPRLRAPYRLCGLSCHAIVGIKENLGGTHRFQPWFVHDQPTPEAYRHLEDFDFQVMLWEDDVWYLELAFPPPSVDDAYKVITTTLGGPTTRWQMMRHWNVLNPGDHDYGMDDVKGPEATLVQTREGLGQDPEYMRRNFEIVAHLMTGEDAPRSPEVPKRWRRWKMPDGDFSLLVLDARLWRTSQDTNIWVDQGWGHKENLYDRRDATRTLLGEEQFAWLREMVRTDSSPLMCLTGLNALLTVWDGRRNLPPGFEQRDRAAADYAGWVAAGTERVFDLLGSRPGVVTVYGDVHNGCILRNEHHRVYESSFGPIGRTGGRRPKPDFGPEMTDYNGQKVRAFALYHEQYANALLEPNLGPTYWNFLEMDFDPRQPEPRFALRIRNLIDRVGDEPRGGGGVEVAAVDTGRVPTSRLAPLRGVLPHAEVLIATADGRPVRGTQSLADGSVPEIGLVDVEPGTPLIVTANRGGRTEARVVETEPWTQAVAR